MAISYIYHADSKSIALEVGILITTCTLSLTFCFKTLQIKSLARISNFSYTQA